MAGKIPQDFLANLISQSNLLELAKERGVSFKNMGHRAKALCPFHDEKSASFTIDTNKGYYHCFGCGVHGDAIGFVMAYDHLDFLDAVEYLANRLGMVVPKDNQNSDQPKIQKHWYEIMQQCSNYYQQNLLRQNQFQFVRDYVKKRGLTAEICKQFLIGYAPDEWNNLTQKTVPLSNQKDLLALGMMLTNDKGNTYDRFRGRLMFPIRDTLGRIRGFGGRILDQGQPKYLNSPDTELFHKHQILYGLYETLQLEKQPSHMLVVEGYMDVVSLFQHGVGKACATLGTATSPDHLRLLLRYTNHIIFCFDGDNAGKKAALKALEISLRFMHDGNHIQFLFLPEGADPDSYILEHGKQAFDNYLKQALSADDYLFQHLNDHYAKYSLADKAQYAKEAQALINLVPKGIYQNMLLEKLSQMLETTMEQLNTVSSDNQTASTQTKQTTASFNTDPLNTTNKCVHLLLEYPELVHQESIQDLLDMLKLQGGQKLLCFVYQSLTTMQKPNTAAFLRTVENEKLKTFLTNLLLKPCALTEEQATQELVDGCTHLSTLQQKQHIQDLLAQAKQRPLSLDEKQMLSVLLESVKN